MKGRWQSVEEEGRMTFSLRIKVHPVYEKHVCLKLGTKIRWAERKGKQVKLVYISKVWTTVQNFDLIDDVTGNHDIAFMTKIKRIYTQSWIRKGSCDEEKNRVWNKYVEVKIEKGWCQTLCNQSVLWSVQKICKDVFKWKIRTEMDLGLDCFWNSERGEKDNSKTKIVRSYITLKLRQNIQ